MKLYAIVRNDIHLPIGKLAAQAGHAFLNAALQAPPELLKEYQGESNIGTKVTLQANLQEILEIHAMLTELKVPCSLIVDSGHICLPDFDGSPIVTALGVFPTPKQAQLLKHLKLYQ